MNIPIGMRRSLFADDGALWTRGRNIERIVEENARRKVEEWES